MTTQSNAPFVNILVPTDFSEHAERAVGTAVSLAQSFGGRITVLHVGVVPHMVATEFGASVQTGPLFQKLAQEVHEQQKARLAKLVETHVPDSIEVVTVIREGFGPEEISTQVLEGAHDLVVMGSHGRTGLTRALLGSVTERVVRECSAPVLVVK